jgi:endonuclease V-like protein UPF0215 family
VALDDGPSPPHRSLQVHEPRASIVAVWFKGLAVDRVRLGIVRVDALDSTDVILKLLRMARTEVVLLAGASLAGFNLVDCRRLHRVLKVPVIVISREKPDNASVKRALKKHFPDWKPRWKLVKNLGRIHKFAPKPTEPPLYFEVVGISALEAKRIISSYCVTSRVPEPVRVAAILARGLALGERGLSGDSLGLEI